MGRNRVFVPHESIESWLFGRDRYWTKYPMLSRSNKFLFILRVNMCVCVNISLIEYVDRISVLISSLINNLYLSINREITVCVYVDQIMFVH